jgi:hypothetical protein
MKFVKLNASAASATLAILAGCFFIPAARSDQIVELATPADGGILPGCERHEASHVSFLNHGRAMARGHYGSFKYGFGDSVSAACIASQRVDQSLPTHHQIRATPPVFSKTGFFQISSSQTSPYFASARLDPENPLFFRIEQWRTQSSAAVSSSRIPVLAPLAGSYAGAAPVNLGLLDQHPFQGLISLGAEGVIFVQRLNTTDWTFHKIGLDGQAIWSVSHQINVPILSRFPRAITNGNGSAILIASETGVALVSAINGALLLPYQQLMAVESLRLNQASDADESFLISAEQGRKAYVLTPIQGVGAELIQVDHGFNPAYLSLVEIPSISKDGRRILVFRTVSEFASEFASVRVLARPQGASGFEIEGDLTLPFREHGTVRLLGEAGRIVVKHGPTRTLRVYNRSVGPSGAATWTLAATASSRSANYGLVASSHKDRFLELYEAPTTDENGNSHFYLSVATYEVR